jgi:hypothetical protein
MCVMMIAAEYSIAHPLSFYTTKAIELNGQLEYVILWGQGDTQSVDNQYSLPPLPYTSMFPIRPTAATARKGSEQYTMN